MDDLIRRQDAIDCIDAVFPVDPMKSEYTQGIACGAALAKTYVEQLPPVDAVEVVRCKDCIHYKGMAECECVPECGGTMWFCAWGERKTDG